MTEVSAGTLTDFLLRRIADKEAPAVPAAPVHEHTRTAITVPPSCLHCGEVMP